VHARKLTEMLPVLKAAAVLAGLRLAETEPEVEIPLVADVRGLHKRRVYESWHTSGRRCGDWSALHRQGAKLRAHPNPEGMQAYLPPRPYETMWRDSTKGHAEKVMRDPEDARPQWVPVS
jgi:hypothetical protein